MLIMRKTRLRWSIFRPTQKPHLHLQEGVLNRESSGPLKLLSKTPSELLTHDGVVVSWLSPLLKPGLLSGSTACRLYKELSPAHHNPNLSNCPNNTPLTPPVKRLRSGLI